MEAGDASGSQPVDTQEAERKREKQERILARRRRVESKLEAKRRTEAGEEPEEVSETATSTSRTRLLCL